MNHYSDFNRLSALACFILVASMTQNCSAVVVKRSLITEFGASGQNEQMQNAMLRQTIAKTILDSVFTGLNGSSIRSTTPLKKCGTPKKIMKILREELRKIYPYRSLPLRNHAHITVTMKGPCEFIVIFPLRKRFLVEVKPMRSSWYRWFKLMIALGDTDMSPDFLVLDKAE